MSKHELVWQEGVLFVEYVALDMETFKYQKKKKSGEETSVLNASWAAF